MSYVQIDGVESSAETRSRLKALGKPVLLSFSRGKDSLGAWLALRDDDIPVIPFTFIRIPGVKFVEESLAYYEEFFGSRIYRIIHPSTLGQLRHYLFTDPMSCSVIDAANIPPLKYEEVDDWLRDSYAEPDTWVADGVRAADSIRRRMSMVKTGPMYEKTRKVHPIWDWKISHIREAIADSGVELPVDYEWFGRSWDGLQYDYMAPLAEHRPDDFEIVKEWFPLVEAVFVRHELEAKYGNG